MSSLPSGAVTFLFTDIEGSTRLWEEHPEGMVKALASHDRLLDRVITEKGGRVVKSTGDGAYAVFHHPQDAVEAALAAQLLFQDEQFPEVGALRVRMVVHAGVTEERDGDYFGPALNRAARVLTAGHGGQVLLTETAHELVADGPLSGVVFRDLGLHRLRDVSAPERLFQVVADGLSSEFPPLRSLGAFTHNLPVQLTSFVGRGEEMEKITNLLGEGRHVTVVGPGGAGKTRLAVQVAAELVENYPDGVWYVDLRDISAPTRVGSQVASTLRIQLAGDKPVREQVVDALWWRKLLLILDNCEHVVTETAWLVGEALQRGGELRTLATTRQPLGIAGESMVSLGSLSLPEQADPDQLQASEAVQLFTERARHVRPDFTSQQHAEPILQICRTLEGLPLAIELAAARLRAISPEDLASRLGDHLSLLRTPGTIRDHRHDTMEATIAWSWDLLTGAEQTLFTRLSLFPTSFALPTAEAICGFDPLDEHQILDLITSLVDKSLLTLENTSDTTRYRMLEPIRQYAETKLDPDTTTQNQHRHVDYWTTSLPRPDTTVRSGLGSNLEAAGALEPDHANLAAAVEWAFDFERYEDALNLVGGRYGGLLLKWGALELVTGWVDRALEHREDVSIPVLLDALETAAAVTMSAARNDESLGYSRLAEEISRNSDERYYFQLGVAEALNRQGRYDEAYPIFDSVYQNTDDAGLQASVLMAKGSHYRLGERAWELVERAINLAPLDSLRFYDEPAASAFVGATAFRVGEYDLAEEMLERARDLSRDLVVESWSLFLLAGVLSIRGQFEEASRTIDEAIRVARRILGTTPVIGWALLRAAEIRRLQGNLDQADDYADQGAEAARRNEQPIDEVWAGVQHALNVRDRGDLEEAARLLADGRQRMEQLGSRFWIRQIRRFQASVEIRRGEPELAAGLLREVLAEWDRLSHNRLVDALDLAAVVLAQLGRTKPAARLLGAVDGQREDLGLVIPPPDLTIREQAVERARRDLGTNWETEYQAGCRLTLDQAVDLALTELDR